MDRLRHALSKENIGAVCLNVYCPGDAGRAGRQRRRRKIYRIRLINIVKLKPTSFAVPGGLFIDLRNYRVNQKDLETEIKGRAQAHNATVHEIDPREIVISEWVRWKCQFGCKGYGKHLSCPPYVPGPEETRKLLSEYKKAYIVRFPGIPGMKDIDPDKIPKNWHPFLKDMITWIHDTMYEIEQHAFYQGYYKALAFAAYPCIYCEDCVSEQMQGVVDKSVKRECRHAEKVRTSMEAAGIDVFATVRKLNLPINVVPCKANEYGMITTTELNSYGLLLVY